MTTEHDLASHDRIFLPRLIFTRCLYTVKFGRLYFPPFFHLWLLDWAECFEARHKAMQRIQTFSNIERQSLQWIQGAIREVSSVLPHNMRVSPTLMPIICDPFCICKGTDNEFRRAIISILLHNEICKNQHLESDFNIKTRKVWAARPFSIFDWKNSVHIAETVSRLMWECKH